MPMDRRIVVTAVAVVCCVVGGVAAAGSAAGAAVRTPVRAAAVPTPGAATPNPAPATPTAAPTPIPSASSPSPTAPPAGTATPSVTPGIPPGVPPADQDSGGCGWFDVGCKVKRAINGWFKDLVKSAINPVFGLLGKSLLATPQLDEMGRIQDLWTGSLVVANTCFVLLVVIGGLILMGHQTVQTSYTVKDIAPRLVIGMVAANVSLLLVGKAIGFANALSAGLLGQGVDPATVAGQLQKIILHAINPMDVGAFIVMVVLWAVILGTILTFIYVLRVMLTILLIAAAPLALACHALPQTEGLAKLWWRAFAGVLAIQVAQALVFITAMKVLLTTDMITWFGFRTPGDQLDLWIVLCLLYILVRIPSWISRMVWQGTLSRSPIVRTAKTIAMIVLFRGLLGKAGTARTRRPAAAPRPQLPPGRPTPPKALPAGPPPPPPSQPQPQPRWAAADKRWMPPDPAWHERVHRGRPDADSVSEQQRWGNPRTTWRPPYAGNWRTPPPPPPPRPPAPRPYQPDPNRPWKRPT